MLNYRHSLKTLNSHLAKVNHKVGYFMQAGVPTYTFYEKADTQSGYQICGFAYSATDAADITNKICKL